MKILSTLLLFSLIVFLASCSKNDNPVASNQKPKPEEPAVPQIQLPSSVSNSNDAHATQTSSFVAMANSFSQYSSFFTPPESSLAKIADGDGSWDYTWNDGTLVVTLHYRKNEEGCSWVVVLNGTEPSSEVVYSNWTMMEVEQNSDGTSGSMTIYEDNSTNPEFEYSWTNDGSGNAKFEYTSNGENGSKFDITTNSDNSGSLQYYEYVNGQFVMTSKIIWTSTDGEWWEYNYQGNQTGHGTF